MVQALFLNHSFGVYRENTFFSGLFLNEEFLASFGMYNAFSNLSAVSHLVKKKKNPFSSRELFWSQFPEIGLNSLKGYFHSVDASAEPCPGKVGLHLYPVHAPSCLS